jgi:energy-coupling factor transporter ATP-binding protein EcfA2
VIEFVNVEYRYPHSSSTVLRGLSLRIPDHGMVSIMGANGSGKSTAALCMNGILVPRNGTVTVDGLKTSEAEERKNIRRSVGVVFQNPNRQFTSLTVERELAFGLENAGMGREEMASKVEEFLELFDLGRYRETMPSMLSGGEKQRVALASVAVLDPRYLVLDEATSLLAPESRRMILRYAIETTRRRETTLVLITQFPEEAMLADQLMVFRHGTLEEAGHPQELLRNTGLMNHLGISVPLSLQLGIDGL